MRSAGGLGSVPNRGRWAGPALTGPGPDRAPRRPPAAGIGETAWASGGPNSRIGAVIERAITMPAMAWCGEIEQWWPDAGAAAHPSPAAGWAAAASSSARERAGPRAREW